MARPNKYNLQYFPLDVTFFEDHKVLMIEEDYGFKGGYIALRLLAMVYEQSYFLEWKDNQELSIARRIGNGTTSALVSDILKSCLKHELFDRNLFDEHKVLSSRGIQKRWLQVMTLMRRKVEVNAQIWLIDSEETPQSSEETTASATFSTQKERKGKEIKGKNVLPAEPSTPKKIYTKKIEETEPFWESLVEVWHKFGIEKFGAKPSFKDRDPKIFKSIVQQLKKRAGGKNVEWNEKNAPRYLMIFLEKAFSDKWLSTHFLLKNLSEQFDKIAQNQESKNNRTVAVTDLQYLYERFLEGELNKQLIQPLHFEELHKKHLVEINKSVVDTRMKSLLGSTNFSDSELYKFYESGKKVKAVEDDKPNLMRIAVIKYFEKLKSEKRASA